MWWEWEVMYGAKSGRQTGHWHTDIIAIRLADCLGHANSPKKKFFSLFSFCSRLSRGRKFMKSKRAAVKKVIRKLRCALQLRPSFLWSSVVVVSPVLAKYANKKKVKWFRDVIQSGGLQTYDRSVRGVLCNIFVFSRGYHQLKFIKNKCNGNCELGVKANCRRSELPLIFWAPMCTRDSGTILYHESITPLTWHRYLST